MEYFLNCLTCNFPNNSQRARRKEFWYFVFFCTIIIVLWNLVWKGIDYCLEYFGGNLNSPNFDPFVIFYIVGYFSLYLLLFCPVLVNINRRLQDTGASIAAFVLPAMGLLLIYFFCDINHEKYIGICFKILFAILCCFLLKKGTKGNNKYGPDPRLFDPVELAHKAQQYLKLAEQGNIEAQSNLGICYYNGFGVSKDLEEAVTWFQKAAEQGNARAQCNLGICYYNGSGVSKDLEEAVSWFSKAANNSEAEAQYMLGVCYKNGEGVSQDMEEAFSWFYKAANNGSATAQYNLGVCFAEGLGVSKNLEEAELWFRTAELQGDVGAKCVLRISSKKNVVNHEKLLMAIALYNQAVEQGDEDALNNLIYGNPDTGDDGDLDDGDDGDDDWDFDFDD